MPEKFKAPEADVSRYFTEAWIECMTEHEATLVSGPCGLCTAKHTLRLIADRTRSEDCG